MIRRGFEQKERCWDELGNPSLLWVLLGFRPEVCNNNVWVQQVNFMGLGITRPNVQKKRGNIIQQTSFHNTLIQCISHFLPHSQTLLIGASSVAPEVAE